jgi:cytochrome c
MSVSVVPEGHVCASSEPLSEVGRAEPQHLMPPGPAVEIGNWRVTMRIVLAMTSAVSLLWLAGGVTMAADVDAGEKVFVKCMQCHRIGLGATNFYGPVLNGLIGRKAGTVPGYKYSAATENSGIIWTPDTLSSYLKQPKHDVPGTNMTFPGLQSQTDIDNVIAYIGQFSRDGGKN